MDLPNGAGAESFADMVAAASSIAAVLAFPESCVELLEQFWVELGELGSAEDGLYGLAVEALVAFARRVFEVSDLEPLLDELADQDLALRLALLVDLVEQLR